MFADVFWMPDAKYMRILSFYYCVWHEDRHLNIFYILDIIGMIFTKYY